MAQHRDSFNEDADMVQRAMIQIFYLNKGGLNSYRIGQYDAASANGFYDATLGNGCYWSSIADEVGNFCSLGLHVGQPVAVPLNLDIVRGIWNQFSLILAAGIQPEQGTTTTPAYDATWVPTAVDVSSLTMPEEFAPSSAEVLKAIVKQEGNKHSWQRQDPLAVSSVDIGQTHNAGNTHTYTDGGLGYCKVQPYRADIFNLYNPQENLIRGAEILQEDIASAPGTTPDEVVWFTCYKYHHGSYGPADNSPAQLRAAGALYADGVNYADAVFGFLNLTPP